MTSHHAVEILLTRPADPSERRYIHNSWLAMDADHTRLMAVCSARSPSGALYALRRQLGARLPIHVLTTHYPDRHGQVLSTSPWTTPPWGPCAKLRPSWGSVPRSCCGGGWPRPWPGTSRNAPRRLEVRLESLLADQQPEEVLACVAGLLHSRRHHPARTAP
ncbi:hypothetical protein NX794_31420 [Streptomyces sp. LP11]|uniref:Uncharacterized protein n=1 Tax=Streptomyces pyxinicus TaxID=2970331 RepID=A0ABT2BAY3_9ACTN|nr:hypothetical protein [Streptomyces sp. LP11]MCS0605680.1 hypothetical protein [Streptomyces sp. LP11]